MAVWSHPTSVEDGLDSFANLMESGYDTLWEMSGKAGQAKIFKGMLPLLHDTCERILTTDERFSDKDVYTLVYLGSEERARGKGNVRTMFDYMFENILMFRETTISRTWRALLQTTFPSIAGLGSISMRILSWAQEIVRTLKRVKTMR